MHGVRIDRLNQQLREEIASIVQFEVKDPGIGFVTITKVEISKDLSNAKVWFSCLGDAVARERTQDALDRSGGYIRSLLKKRLRLKVIPQFVFRYDDTVELSIAMAAKLDQLKSPPPES